MMKKLLFITPELPYPAQSGGKVKSLKLLQSLAQRYEITLASPLKLDDASNLDAFHQVSPCSEHIHEAVSVPRTPVNLLASYVRGVPLNVHRTFSKNLAARIAAVADEFDVIFLDHYEVQQYLPADFAGLTIYHAHNAYFKMWQRYAELPGNPAMRAVAYIEARRVKSYESSVAKNTAMTFAAPNDCLELQGEGVALEKLHNTFHLGDDKQLELPELRYADTHKKLMYVGFLGWEPNAQGLLWFIDQVWPRLITLHPDLRFDIVGKNPDARLQAAVARHEGISLLGFVDDLQSIYSSSRVSVAPLLFGSGMKVKVLDAMARGMPTVTTSVGAEGIAITPGAQLLVADEPAAMAQEIDSLLTDPQLWLSLVVNSRALVRERYTWGALFDQMHRDIDAMLRQGSSESGGREASEIAHAG